MTRIAIIGAGFAGLTLAYFLRQRSTLTIDIYEKSRGVSGRMSTRYADPFQFDHAAQYFTARSKEFQDFLEPFIASGLVQAWQGKVVTLAKGEKPYKRDWFEPHYVACPKMNELCKIVSEGHQIHLQWEVTQITGKAGAWILHHKEGIASSAYDWVICTAPAPQTARLLPDAFAYHQKITATEMVGCFSLMLGFVQPLPLHWHAAKVKDSPIGWISVNSAKPDRNTGYSLLAQSTHAWAEEHLEKDTEQNKTMLMQELAELLSHDVTHATYSTLHRWRYADTVTPAGEPFLLDSTSQLAACGDWCIAGRVEAAFLSAYSLAQSLRI